MSSNGTDGRSFWDLQGFTIMTFKKENILLSDWTWREKKEEKNNLSGWNSAENRRKISKDRRSAEKIEKDFPER